MINELLVISHDAGSAALHIAEASHVSFARDALNQEGERSGTAGSSAPECLVAQLCCPMTGLRSVSKFSGEKYNLAPATAPCFFKVRTLLFPRESHLFCHTHLTTRHATPDDTARRPCASSFDVHIIRATWMLTNPELLQKPQIPKEDFGCPLTPTPPHHIPTCWVPVCARQS